MYFVYDSYHVGSEDWAALLLAGGGSSEATGGGSGAAAAAAAAVAETPGPGPGLGGRRLPGLFVGLWLERGHGAELARGGCGHLARE